jgi:hypothetical protein
MRRLTAGEKTKVSGSSFAAFSVGPQQDGGALARALELSRRPVTPPLIFDTSVRAPSPPPPPPQQRRYHHHYQPEQPQQQQQQPPAEEEEVSVNSCAAPSHVTMLLL